MIKTDNKISDTGFTTSVFAKNVAHPDAEESFARELARGEKVESDEVKKGKEENKNAKSLARQSIKNRKGATK